MLFFLDKIANLNCHWNERSLNVEDFHRICGRHKIKVVEMPLQVSGFYYCVMGKHYIAINSRLDGERKLFVMFHEFAHYLMHAPDKGVTANFHGIGKKSREESEADAFAICAMIPRTFIESSRIAELCEDEGFSAELMDQRIACYKRYGI